MRLAYRAFGSGRPIVFVMGLSGTMDAWDPRFLDAVAAQGRRVVVFDNEGMGRSRVRPGTMTIRRLGDDVAALIRALRLRRPDVFAWSMGGMIGQSLAVRHPRRVRRLVLAASAPGDGRVVPSTGRGAEVLLSREESPLSALDTLFAPGATAARDAYAANVALRRGAAPVGPRSTIDAQLGASAVWLSGRDPDGRRVRRLRMPVLVAGGELDELLPVGNSRYLARRIPRARLVVYRDASHAFFLQKRIDFLRRLDRFLG
ncbi:MAG TPA: alpha/beta hydrolase [Solirubrobacteraceae bacterium]|nr:alpha/beta hydrolase [Solirubrobacteraceae bacterium]